MTDINFTGKLAKLELNVDLVTKAGKDWTAHKLQVEGANGSKTFLVSTKAQPAKYIEGLSEGQDITVTTGGQFNSVVKVSAAGATSGRKPAYQAAAKPAFKDNTHGMIKGNAISNGVQLAIARQGKNATLEDIRQATLEIISLHLELEYKGLNEAVNSLDAPKAKARGKKVEETKMPLADNDLSDDLEF